MAVSLSTLVFGRVSLALLPLAYLLVFSLAIALFLLGLILIFHGTKAWEEIMLSPAALI